MTRKSHARKNVMHDARGFQSQQARTIGSLRFSYDPSGFFDVLDDLAGDLSRFDLIQAADLRNFLTYHINKHRIEASKKP